jgi:two-component system cell cycle response regulator DivK
MPKTVMIVEDNELNMKLFHDLLEAHGYRTVSTRDGFKVPDLARKHRPDLILMDIQLPEVSGLEVTNWLKEDPELQAIPVVAVTAFAMKGDEERSVKAVARHICRSRSRCPSSSRPSAVFWGSA